MSDGDIKKIGDLIDQKVRPLVKTLGSIQNTLGSMQEDLGSVHKTMDSMQSKIDTIQETLDAHTGSLMKIEATLEGYADAYKINKGNIERLDERLAKAEDQLDIPVSPELAIQR